MKISIVFSVFNGLGYTKRCLESLFENIQKTDRSKVIFEIVIIDDGSSDGTSDWIHQHYPSVYLLAGSGDLWWSGAMNKGIRFALDKLQTDYVLWWNNDVMEDKNYFDQLYKVMIENEPNTLIGSKIYLDSSFKTIWSMGGIFNVKTGYKEMIGSGYEDGKSYDSPVECDWLTGMGSFIHSSVFEKIGDLDDENFPQYHGDADFTLRASKVGFKVMVDPCLKIYNDTSNSGLKHDNSISNLWKSLFSIKSNYNIIKDFKFYQKHTTGILAYRVVLAKYLQYIGGFVKWKILNGIGVHRK